MSLSAGQVEVLQRLCDGWRLQFRSMARAIWFCPKGEFAEGGDMRRINGLWKRKLIEVGEREPDHANRDVRYFSLTEAGRAAIKETT
jgi:hypothetical protein